MTALDPLDETALKQCIDVYLAQSDGRRQHVDEILADQGWRITDPD